MATVSRIALISEIGAAIVIGLGILCALSSIGDLRGPGTCCFETLLCCMTPLACCLFPFGLLAWVFGAVMGLVAMVKKEDGPEWKISLGIAGGILCGLLGVLLISIIMFGLRSMVNLISSLWSTIAI